MTVSLLQYIRSKLLAPRTAGMAFAAASAFALCSCRSPQSEGWASDDPYQAGLAPGVADGQVMPAEYLADGQIEGYAGEGYAGDGRGAEAYDEAALAGGGYGPNGEWIEAPPQPYNVGSTWTPPGSDEPFPADEYLHDGGDAEAGVAVSPEWEVLGLDVEDTVAHYDALDGRTLVEASNRVHIYAPRFGAVRTVTGAGVHDQVNQVVGVRRGSKVGQANDVGIASTKVQRERIVRQFSAELPNAFRTRQGREGLVVALGPERFDDSFQLFEDMAVVRNGRLDHADKARLAESTQAAILWTKGEAVRVMLEGKAAAEIAADRQAMVIYTIDDLRDSPKLRLVKLASTATAHPGDFVDFTLRFDNVGDQPIGNIVLLDKLPTRLEYVPDSAQSSMQTDFHIEDNEASSGTLRWEIDAPLEPGEGGVVRFRCKVR